MTEGVWLLLNKAVIARLRECIKAMCFVKKDKMGCSYSRSIMRSAYGYK